MTLSLEAVVGEFYAIREGELRYEQVGPDIMIGQTVADLGMTRAMLASTTPREWESVASFLIRVLDREPFVHSPRYSGERILLGALSNELRAYARAAGEPVGDAD